MKKTLLTLALSLASVACVQASSTTSNKYYILDSSGSYPTINEVSKEQACTHKAAPSTKNDYKPPVLSLIKDECSNATIHPNAVVLIKGKRLQESELVSE